MAKRTSFFKKTCFKKLNLLWNFRQSEQNFETTINKSINHTKFVYRWQETFKIGVHTAKCRLPINSCYKLFFFPRYLYIKKWKLSIFFLFKGKKHVSMTSIKIMTKFPDVFSRFKENENVINISFAKKLV